MYALFAIAITGYLHDWSMQQHLQQSDREIVMCDVYRFGATRETAYAMYLTSRTHYREMADEIRSWNHPEAFGWWERDCERRIKCWSKLDDAFRIGNALWTYGPGPDGHFLAWPDFSRDVAYRLSCLYDLRALIGREAFEAGVMPSPFPEYKRLPWK